MTIVLLSFVVRALSSDRQSLQGSLSFSSGCQRVDVLDHALEIVVHNVCLFVVCLIA